MGRSRRGRVASSGGASSVVGVTMTERNLHLSALYYTTRTVSVSSSFQEDSKNRKNSLV
jgi:hypothetical protein